MKNEKLEILKDMIRRMDIKDKLRLAICMCDSDWLYLEYDKNKYLQYFDKLLKENDEKYRTTLINFAKYKLVMLTIAGIMELEQSERNKIALFLYNTIEFEFANDKKAI